MLPLEHSAILFTCFMLPPVFKTYVLSIFEWALNDGLVLEVVDDASTSLRTSPLLSSDDAKMFLKGYPFEAKTAAKNQN